MNDAKKRDVLRRSKQVLSTFLFQPDKYGKTCKALLDSRACCDRITFPVLERLEQNISKILSIRGVALADLHGKLSPIPLLSFVGQFSKFGFCENSSDTFHAQNSVCQKFRAFFPRKIATFLFKDFHSLRTT